MSKKQKTLNEQFKGNVLEALFYIADNDCKIECRDDIDSQVWRKCKIKQLLKEVIHKGFQNKSSATISEYMLNFYRINSLKPDKRNL